MGGAGVPVGGAGVPVGGAGVPGGGAGVPVGGVNDDLHCAVSETPMETTNDSKYPEEGKTKAYHQSDEPDLTSSDNDFHLTYTSTSDCDSDQEKGGGGSLSSCEGPSTVRCTRTILMSLPIGGVAWGSHPVGGVGGPSGALSHTPSQGEKAGTSHGLGTSEPIGETREIPSPEVKSKYGLDSEVCGGLVPPAAGDRVGAFEYACMPPSVEELMGVTKELGLPREVYVKPFCGKPDDVQPARCVCANCWV